MTKSWLEYANDQDSQKIYLADLELAQSNGSITTTTLRLSNVNHIDDSDNFYEGRFDGIPAFSRRLQEVLGGGKSQISFGRMEIRNPDDEAGNLDAYLQDYTWEGRGVSVRLGFEGQSTVDFKTVLTGVMGEPEYDDDTITVPVSDDQEYFVRRMLPSGSYSDTAPELLKTFLSNAGISNAKIEPTMFAAWSNANPFNCSFIASNATEIGTAIDNLLAGTCCWYGFNREGVFEVANFEAAASGASPDLDLTDVEILSCKVRRIKRYWKVRAGYWDMTASPPTQDPPTVSRELASIKNLNPLAVYGGTKTTLLTDSADAETVRDRWWGLLSVPHRVATVRAKVQPFTVKLGSVVSLARDRFSITGNWRVIGITENYAHNEVELELLQ